MLHTWFRGKRLAGSGEGFEGVFFTKDGVAAILAMLPTYREQTLVTPTGARSKIFNEIILKDNHLLTLHEKCI